MCNHVMDVLLRGRGRGGFVHVPPLEVLPLETQVRAARYLATSSTT